MCRRAHDNRRNAVTQGGRITWQSCKYGYEIDTSNAACIMCAMAQTFADNLLDWLRPLRVRALRMEFFCAKSVPLSISMLRGVWGRALHQINRDTFDIVFEGKGPPSRRQPLYIIRPHAAFCGDDPRRISIEWLVWDDAADKFFDQLREAWDVAGAMGLADRRAPFVVTASEPLFGGDDVSTSLTDIVYTMRESAEPCRLAFPIPLRLMRHGRLVTEPTFVDLIEATFFRLSPFLASAATESRNPKDLWPPFAEALVALATTVLATKWEGEPVMWERYSGRQKSEVQQSGVIGSLSLCDGCGILWPLLAAASVLHLGKATVMGLGRLVIG